MSHDKRLSLFVFIDALGWEIAKRHELLPDVLQTSQPLNTVFGYSCTCDPTIITGKMPHEHGHFSFYNYAPERSPFKWTWPLRFLPKSLTRRGRVRHQLSKFVKWKIGYTGYFQLYNTPLNHLPLYEYTEKRDLYEPGGINNGCPTIFDHLRDNRIAYSMSDWRKPEPFNIAALKDDLRQGDVTFAYLYLAGLDGIMHADGTHSPRVADKVAWYDEQLRGVLETAKQNYGDVRLFLFSDHGMTNVEHDYDLQSVVAQSGMQFGKDYVAMYDSTMARFWFLREGAEARIREVLANEQHGNILNNLDLNDFGALFPNRRYGELFFLANPGVLICPSFMNETHLNGMHGYTPYDEDSVAWFGSSESLNEPPQRLDDLYALMRREVDGADEDNVETEELEAVYSGL